VLVFDINQHGAYPVDKTVRPQFRCLGHTQEGFGLSWSPHRPGRLLSGSNDSSICLWDVTQAGTDVQPLLNIPNAHKGAVGDVDWHKTYEFLFGSCGDDSAVLLWDDRQNNKTPSNTLTDAHQGDVLCLSFNAFSEFLFATGGADKSVSVWDLRNLKKGVHKFEGHTDDVLSLCWSPKNPELFASGGADKRILVWNLEKIGEEQTAEEEEDVPPELKFSHGGHTAKVNEFNWHGNDDNLFFAGVDEDNSLQIWQMVRS
jgi:histone-binding protein RBBP4